MSRINVYIAPFALQSPFEVTFNVTSTNDSTASAHLKPTTKLNNLVKELQDLWKHWHELSSSPQRETFPEQEKWIIFCPTRLTFIVRVTIADCNWWESLGNTSSGLGPYVVIPSSLALQPDFIVRMRELSPYAVKYGTPDEAQKAEEHCAQCTLDPSVCVRRAHFSQQLFHMKGKNRNVDLASDRSRLVIWIPGIVLPWEIVLPSDTNPAEYITGLCQWALREYSLESTSANIVTNLMTLGYYPTPENWMLINLKSLTQIHRSSLTEMRVVDKVSLSCIVGSVQCGTLTQQIAAVLKEQGALGWPKFWEGIVAAKLPHQESGDHDKEVPEWTPATSVAGSDYGDGSGQGQQTAK